MDLDINFADSSSTPVGKSTTTWNDSDLVDSCGLKIKQGEIFGQQFTITTTTVVVQVGSEQYINYII